MKISFEPMNHYAKIPRKATEDSTGYDLYSDEKVTILPKNIAIIGTGIRIKPEEFSNSHKAMMERMFNFPINWDIQIRSRSGLSSKFGIFVINAPGTIDIDYRGEVKVPLANFGNIPYTVEIGDRIAQMVFNIRFDWTVFIEEQLDKTERNEGGFGSTGK